MEKERKIMESYIIQSLELHLFFGRIMKEHALFLEAGFPAKECEWIEKAGRYRSEFEAFLEEAVKISGGCIQKPVLCSGEIVTGYTLSAEKETARLTGIPIHFGITLSEQELKESCKNCSPKVTRGQIHAMNQKALQLVNGLIGFKENILKEVNSCRLYTSNYPLLIEHIMREAMLYRSFIMQLMRNGMLCRKDIQNQEIFWNQIMMEHALFIRGLLDPSETELIGTADSFAETFSCLLKEAREKDCRTMDELTKRTLLETERYREFKAAGTKGISDCEISSIILPLLADHVLREANHYIRILQTA